MNLICISLIINDLEHILCDFIYIYIYICLKMEISHLFIWILFYSLYEKKFGPAYLYASSYTVTIMHMKKKKLEWIPVMCSPTPHSSFFPPKPITYMLEHIPLQSLCNQSVTLKAQCRSPALQHYSHPA